MPLLGTWTSVPPNRGVQGDCAARSRRCAVAPRALMESLKGRQSDLFRAWFNLRTRRSAQGDQRSPVPDRTASPRLAHAARLSALADTALHRRCRALASLDPLDPEHCVPRDGATRVCNESPILIGALPACSAQVEFTGNNGLQDIGSAKSEALQTGRDGIFQRLLNRSRMRGVAAAGGAHRWSGRVASHSATAPMSSSSMSRKKCPAPGTMRWAERGFPADRIAARRAGASLSTAG